MSCSKPILTQLNEVSKNIDSCERELLQKHEEQEHTFKKIEKKLNDYKRKQIEQNTELKLATEQFLLDQKDKQNDFRKLLDSEIRFKVAYREYMDLKQKIMFTEWQLQKNKEKLLKIGEEIKDRIEQLSLNSSRVYLKIVETIQNFYKGIGNEKRKMVHRALSKTRFKDLNLLTEFPRTA